LYSLSDGERDNVDGENDGDEVVVVIVGVTVVNMMICFTCFRVGKRQSARALQQRMQPKTDITNPASWTG
jgi:hypothetical protein